MPLFLCPNDNTTMTTVERSGVQFDMCPVCRGVWLDRGELEKLMAAASSDAAAAPQTGAVPPQPQHYPQQSPSQPPPQHWDRGYGERGERGEYGERGERGEHGYGYRKKRSIFDIFD